MNQSVKEEAVYRTASATPGLLIKHLLNTFDAIFWNNSLVRGLPSTHQIINQLRFQLVFCQKLSKNYPIVRKLQ